MRVLSPSRKLLFKISAILAGLLFLIAAVLLVIGIVYGDKVKELVVNEINSHLLVPVEVGQVDFTVFKSFPNASVVFRNVTMKPSPKLKEAPGLLNAESISLRIGLFSLLTGNYKIRSLVIDKASVTLWVGADGKDNFHIWKQSSSPGTSNVKFDMQQVKIINTAFNYRNLIKKTDLALVLPEFLLKGKMSGERYDLQIAGATKIMRFVSGEINYTPASDIGIRGSIQVNELLKRCEITDADVQFAGITAGVRGTIGYGKEDNPINININATEADISEVLRALPETLSEPYKAYQPGGKLTFQTAISGTWGKTSSPFIKAEFELAKGSFTHLETGSKIKDIVLVGNFASTQGRKAEVLNLTAFSGETRNGKFKGRLKLTGFSKPNIDLSLSADLDLAELEGLLKPGEASDLKGKLVADISYRGAYQAGEQMAVASNGLVRLSGAGFTRGNEGVQLKDINGQFELKNGRIWVDGLSAVVGESTLKISGFFDNLIGYILFAGQPLHFDIRFNAGIFRLEDFITKSGVETDSSRQSSIFPPGVSFKAGFSINEFSYKKFTASQASGNLSLDDNVLRASDLRFSALDGKATATGLLNGRYGNQAQVICNAKLTNVDIPRMFYEFNDFGQTSLQSRHMKGRGDATVQYAATLNNRLETDEASVAAVADVEIRNGELLKFEPFQELSKFLDEEELSNVKFSTLSNRIEIARKTVVIPEMSIQTSALNLKGYGSHTFGNDIDYHFSVLMSDLRKNKRRKTPPPATAIEDDGLGRTRLFLHMTGTVDNPVVNYDHRAVVRKIANDFQEEKQELRNAIKQEFSKNKSAETDNKAKTSAKFEIEWDEDK
ncbi:MAG: hypothetical protein IPH20_14810 [Bacteroidales bacterium]|nr:hypothetical protein [Bacteroidales bacterium]